MLARICAFFVWGLLALACTYWLLGLLTRPTPVPAQTRLVADRPVQRSDLSRLLGAGESAEQAAAPQDSRFKLMGIAAPREGMAGHELEGVALISVDNGPARTVRVGALVDGDTHLQALTASSATLAARGQAPITLTLAPLPLASPGALPVVPPATYALAAPMAGAAAPVQKVELPGSGPINLPSSDPAALPPAVQQAVQLQQQMQSQAGGQRPQAPVRPPEPNSLPLSR